MLPCLAEFRHIELANSQLGTIRMPLLEVFIKQFLDKVHTVAKRGLRSDYVVQEGNLTALRGKLINGQQLINNFVRSARFYTQHDDFGQNLAKNRLIHSASRIALASCKSFENQRRACELCFVFAAAPQSSNVPHDLSRIHLERGMAYYGVALD